MNNVKSIGILTSGGDAPGMNAAIRAVTRAGIFAGFKVYGIYRGYRGLIYDEIEEFSTQNVSNIIQRGGTILKTARCKEFQTPEGRQCAYDVLKRRGIDALVVIGGDGSLTGARIFGNEFQIPIVGLPGTIDNDLYGTDTTIGYDTALNTIMECVDKIRDTATSHERLFFIEVMGRDAGFLALNGAIASGAEAAIIPVVGTYQERLPEVEKFLDSACGRKPDHRGRDGTGTACEGGISGLRRARHHPWPPAARRIAYGPRPHPRLAHGSGSR